MRIDFLTLFPNVIKACFDESIIGRAIDKGLLDFRYYQIRNYSKDKHRKVDDYPYGGGPGLVMSYQPIYDAFMDIKDNSDDRPWCIYMSPQGQVLTQKKAMELSRRSHLVILCGHYEGVDERVLEDIVDEEISIGDYVLTGGEIPAMVLADCIGRLVPGVLSSEEAIMSESHVNGLLEYPQYTRPYEINGKKVPDILLSGHHAEVEKWRREQSLERTKRKRPDLYEAYIKGENMDK